MKEETCYLWISQLPPNATQQTLTELFSSYSCVLATKIHEAGNLRGAVLSFPDSKSAAKACAARHLLNGHSLISEHCDQSGEPGLQRLKDLARRDFSEKKSLENGSTSVNNNNSPPIRTQAGKQDGGGKLKVLKVWNFPDRSSDGSIQNGLLHEYRKLGKVSSVQVRGERDDRHALIVFKRAEDAESAYELTKSGKSFFGMTLNVERLEAADDAEPVLDEFHSRASRTLLVSNIEPGVRETDLRDKLAAFGTILDVELRPATEGPTQAIVQFSDIRGAAAALRHPDGVTIGSQRLRLTYHRSQPTDCVWLANLAPAVTEPLLSKTFSCHGRLRDVCVNSHRQCALVFFNEVDGARRAVEAMKCASLAGQRLLLDFASQPCQKHFVDELVTSGQCSDYKREQLREQKLLNKNHQKQDTELNLRHELEKQQLDQRFRQELQQLSRDFDAAKARIRREADETERQLNQQFEKTLRQNTQRAKEQQDRGLRDLRDTLRQQKKRLTREELKNSQREIKERDREAERGYLQELQARFEEQEAAARSQHRKLLDDRQRALLRELHALERKYRQEREECEERHLYERYEMRLFQHTQYWLLKKQQAMERHERDLDRLRKQADAKREVLVQTQTLERRRRPKLLKKEQATRARMFRESLLVTNPGMPDDETRRRLREFDDTEKERCQAELARLEGKLARAKDEFERRVARVDTEVRHEQQEMRKIIAEREADQRRDLEAGKRAQLKEFQELRRREKEALEQRMAEEARELEVRLVADAGGEASGLRINGEGQAGGSAAVTQA